jgi:predicted permease
MGAAIGAVLSWIASRSLVEILSGGAFSLVFDLTPNLHVLGFASGAALATGLLFGLAPAMQATGGKLSLALKEDRRMSRSRSRLLFGLVGAQVAICLLLLNGAGLFVKTLRNLENVDPGFQREGVLVTAVGERRGPARSDADTALFKESLERVRRIPGVVSASISNNTPMSGGTWTSAAVPAGRPVPDADNSHFISIGSRFFETMRLPLVAGREFMEPDQAGSPKVAIVNEEFARRHFAGRNPVGEYITARVVRPPVDLEIVGVVRDAIMDGLRTSPPPTVYVSYFQRPQLDPAVLEIRAAGNFAQISALIRKELEPRLRGMLEIRGLSEQVAASIVRERMMAMLATAFSMLALVLAAVGIYGVLAYTVARRTNEIGIRTALGAQRLQLLGMVIKDAVRMLVFGVALGLPAAWAVSRWVSSLLFGVAPNDPPTMMLAAGLLLCAGLGAGFLPAHRASKVDAMAALRDE